MVETDQLCAEWRAFEEELGFRPQIRGPTYGDIIRQDNENDEAILARYTFSEADTSIETEWHETKSGVWLRSYRPPSYRANQPVVYYIHGGGFVIGSVENDDSKMGPLCQATVCVFVSVEYRLAPQHKFPAGFEDCVEGARWCIESAERLGGSKGTIVIMGKSAGGSLAFGFALKLIDEGRQKNVKGVVACQPVTVHPDAVPEGMKARYESYEENAETTSNTRDGMYAFYSELRPSYRRATCKETMLMSKTDLYGAPVDDAYTWCLLNPNLASLPRVYLNGCGADTLRDDARLMKALLDQCKVSSHYDEFAGLPHDFFAFPSDHLEALRKEYFAKTANGIEWVINGGEISL